MKTRLLFLLLLAAGRMAQAQSISPPGEIAQEQPSAPPPPAVDVAPAAPAPAATPSTRSSRASTAGTQQAIDHLTRANQELLDLLVKQQAVLQDIQYDRRLQNRQITLLEQRLEETLQLNASLQAKASKLEGELEMARTLPAAVGAAPSTPAGSTSDRAKDNAAPPAAVSAIPSPSTPPPPASFLPPEQTAAPPGQMMWHRLLLLSGEDSKNSDLFHITGKQWRVLWHNQDRPGDSYKNTSALFISAFPKNDTLPKKVCSQLGSGGDATELTGSGDFYLKVEASGGRWELAVEDFR